MHVKVLLAAPGVEASGNEAPDSMLKHVVAFAATAASVREFDVGDLCETMDLVVPLTSPFDATGAAMGFASWSKDAIEEQASHVGDLRGASLSAP